MPRRHQRHAPLLDGQRQRTIESLRSCRAAMIDAQRGLKPRSATYALAGAVVTAIDKLAEVITGDREIFWSQPHSTSDADGSKVRRRAARE